MAYLPKLSVTIIHLEPPENNEEVPQIQIEMNIFERLATLAQIEVSMTL